MTPGAQKSLEKWLHKHYAETTAYQTIVDLGTIERHLETPDALGHNQRYAARRIAKWAAEAGEALPPGWDALLESRSPAAHRPSVRKYDARSFEPADWQALLARLQGSEKLEDRLLELAQLTGLRAGDVLRIERKNLAEAALVGRPLLVTAKGGKMRWLLLGQGPLLEAAQKLHDQLTGMEIREGTLAEALIPKSQHRLNRQLQHHPYRAAYQRLLRRLKELGEELEADGRLHTHRLRRTAAVAALRGGVDLATVQQMLGHSSIVVTQKYLDEERHEDVAIAMDKFHNQLGGKAR
jgi:integrase